MHMRRVGQSLIDKYFARAGHHRHALDNGHDPAATAAAVRAAEAELIAAATEYDRIRSLGLRPRWVTDRNRWVNPREFAVDVLGGWLKRHQFGRDNTNDANVLEQIAADLYPAEEAR